MRAGGGGQINAGDTRAPGRLSPRRYKTIPRLTMNRSLAAAAAASFLNKLTGRPTDRPTRHSFVIIFFEIFEIFHLYTPLYSLLILPAPVATRPRASSLCTP